MDAAAATGVQVQVQTNHSHDEEVEAECVSDLSIYDLSDGHSKSPLSHNMGGGLVHVSHVTKPLPPQSTASSTGKSTTATSAAATKGTNPATANKIAAPSIDEEEENWD